MEQIDKDLATLTTIPLASVQKILSKFQDCICYNVQQSLENINEYIDLDIAIGKLIIKLDEDKICYKFIPSKSFENDLLITINTGECPLIGKLENSVSEKITAAYKEFL